MALPIYFAVTFLWPKKKLLTLLGQLKWPDNRSIPVSITMKRVRAFMRQQRIITGKGLLWMFQSGENSWHRTRALLKSRNLNRASWGGWLYHLCLGNYLLLDFCHLILHFLWHLKHSAYSLLNIFRQHGWPNQSLQRCHSLLISSCLHSPILFMLSCPSNCLRVRMSKGGKQKKCSSD